MKKKAYENLEISVFWFEKKDVIVASGENENVINYLSDENEMFMLS